jgi:hypothetical protein
MCHRTPTPRKIQTGGGGGGNHGPFFGTIRGEPGRGGGQEGERRGGAAAAIFLIPHSRGGEASTGIAS